MNGRRIMHEVPITAAPVVYYLRTPEASEWVMFEFEASSAEDNDRALAVAIDWVHEPPTGTSTDRIIR
jgi:hypothetical protein